MDIKEIALKVAQATNLHYIVTSEKHTNDDWNIRFAEALIESYKAELLNEVGEPVLYAEFAEDGGWLGDASEYADHLEEPHALFTSDQLAAAIIKATKPLEEEIERNATRRYELVACRKERDELRAKLAKSNQLWQVAQGRCDGLEEKLAKAEQRAAEWQSIVTAPKDGTAILGCGGLYNDPKNGWFNTVCWWSGYAFVDDGGDVDYVTHWMPLPKAPNCSSS